MSNKNNDRDTIKVVCRIRPENHLELGGNYYRCVEYTEKNICVECQANETSNFAGRHDFAFDRIYGPDSFQKDVFEEVGAPIIKGILDGFNGTIFAYGQTGSGKTFTMEGPDHNDEDLKGMIPRMFARLFELIEEADDDIEFTVKVSYMEIYMEKIMDLLNPKNTNLLVRKDKTNGVFVKD